MEIGYIKKRSITEEMKESYLDYAMSVIIARALPDVRDGLKPVHRRILYAMHGLGLNSAAKYRKSATVVGEVLGKYHPHGDAAVYDSLVRMAQDFSLRYPLIDGQGNFGCFTKDTKVRLTDGRNLTFGQLIKEAEKGKRNWTFSFNPKTKEIEIAEIQNPRLTRQKEKIIEVTLDNGEKIRCTLDHLFMLRDGSYKKAKDLQPEESLMPLYIEAYQGEDTNLKGYEIIRQPLKNALNYFNSFSEIVAESKKHNHRVIATKVLGKREDVYDLTIEPYHNFSLEAGIFVHNSIDGDNAAAFRYTEARLTKIAEEMLSDIDKETVDWADNYDGTRQEPVVLPAKLPQLLLNGGMGIAVGMATDIPPHNLGELVEGIIFLIDHPQAVTKDLFQFIKGPDFPTGGAIYDRQAMIQAYSTGRGPIVTRAKTEIVEKKAGQFQILITEMTYRSNKANLIVKIADLVKNKKIEGIRDIRDESDKEGIRVVIDLKNEAQPQKILNRLFKLTDLQKAFHLNMLALVNGLQPQVLSLKEILEEYIKHRQEVVRQRSEFELKQAKERAHILMGLSKALDHIDEVIKTIKKSATREIAHQNLIKQFKLSDRQATAILEMRLQTLAGLEQKKIKDELKEKREIIKSLEALLKSPKKILGVIKKELKEIKEKYGDERRTKVYSQPVDRLSEEELVPQEECVIILTQGGYIKRVNPQAYRAQKRGGKGIIAITPREEDVVGYFLSASTHDSILFFTDQGRVFQAKAYEIPEASRTARGQVAVNILQLGSNEQITTVIAVKKEQTMKYLVMATENGIIKRTKIDEFRHVRRSGLMAISLRKGDSLEWAKLTSGQDEIILVTAKGQSVRFKESDVRSMGRTAAGVKGVSLRKDDKLVRMDIIEEKLKDKDLKLLVVTENGFGKKTGLGYYKLQKRGGSGIKTAQLTDKTGNIVASQILREEKEDLIAISQRGQVIRTKLKDIPSLGRATQGVKIMKMSRGDKVASIACL